MFLDQILGNLVCHSGKKQILLAKPCSDHRTLKEGEIFVAIKGTSFDGHDAISEVIKLKPSAIIAQKKIPNIEVPIIEVSNSRLALDKLAHAYFGYPSQKLFCVAVTGTNGKTTTSLMVEHALAKIEMNAGVIGTIDHHFEDKIWETELTTPGPLEFYERLSQFVSLGAKSLSVETSSHALDQNRMSSCEFDVGIFTNLTLDHLDYHKTMEEYFSAKQKLFAEVLEYSSKKNKYAIINTDDEWGRKIQIGASVHKLTYGTKDADLIFEVLSQSYDGQKVLLKYRDQETEVLLQVAGLFNVYNFTSVVGVLLSRGISLEDAAEMFVDFYGVKGRLEKIPNNKNKHIFVDYAHTPDALENVLKTLKSLQTTNKIITVFGCGGDRDKSKRPIMGSVAQKYSDHVIITSDNPRTEEPEQIIKDILVGIKDKKHDAITDRKSAIQKAIVMAKPNDVVLIAGKGHEDYQIIGKTKNHFSDSEVAREFLK